MNTRDESGERDGHTADGAPPQALTAVWDDAWSRLEAGVRDRLHAYRTGVLATAGEDGVDARTVVLRGADRHAGWVRFHTDRRSSKLSQLIHDDRVALVFYGEGVQVRLRGTVCVHHDDALADADWTASPAMARRCYLTEAAPGTPSAVPTSGLPAGLSDARPRMEDTLPGRARFVVVEVSVAALDWLFLAASGQRRAGFSRSGEGWMGTWLVP